MSNIKDPYKKAQRVRDELLGLKKKYNIDKVFIEENLQSFRSGMSSARTLVTLARFNGIISYISESVFKTSPVFINVNAARKSLGIKIIKKSHGGAPSKEQVFDWVDDDLTKNETVYQWPMKTLKSGPRKDQIVLDKRSYDMSDAYVVARAGLILPD